MTNLAYKNVEQIRPTIENYFTEFLKSKASPNTASSYRTDIKQFCKFTFSKEPSYVLLDELLSLTSLQATKFFNYLKDSNAKNATIKRKVESMRSFLNFMKVDYQQLNANIFDNLPLQNVNNDRNGYGNVEWDEAFLFIEYAFQAQSNEMAMLLKLACISSIRLEALLSLNWEENFRTKNENGIIVNYIDTVDKETRHQTPISDSFYDELHTLLGTTGKLFPSLYKHKVGKLLKDILEYFKIDPKRNIKFHSFKKCGVNRVLQKTGDLTKAQLQGKHKCLETTNSYYVVVKDDLTQKPSYTIDQEIDILNEIQHLSHEELLQAISKMSDSSKFELIRILNKG